MRRSNTDPDGKGKTLTLWHYEGDDSAMGMAWNAAINEFEKETGAKVKFEAKSFEQIRSTASQVLNSDSAPDILEYNKGNATAGLLSSQGLLTNLDDAVKAYGWDKKLAPSLQTTAKYDDKGIMGSGHWYGIPNYGEFVEVYYNKDMFAKYGIAVPTTFDEFEAALADVQGQRRHAARRVGGRVPARPALVPARAEQGRPPVGRPTTSSTRARSTSRTRTSPSPPRPSRTGSTRATSPRTPPASRPRTPASRFITGDVPDLLLGQLVVRPLRQTEIKNFEWGTFLLPGLRAWRPDPSGNLWVVPENVEEQGPRLQVHRHHDEPGDPGPHRQQRRHPRRGRDRPTSPTRRARS